MGPNKVLKCDWTFSHYFFDLYAYTKAELFEENLVTHLLTHLPTYLHEGF